MPACPGTVGFVGKFQLIHALVSGDYTWLAIVLVIGSMISLGYYLRVVATMWMRSRPAPAPAPATGMGALAPIAGGSPEADAEGVPDPLDRSEWPTISESVPYPEVALVAAVFAAAAVVFGIVPSPLFDLAAHAGRAIGGLF